MKIILVQCPSWTTESPPYALALLAAALRKDGHEVRCLDFNIELYRFCKEYRIEDSVINQESWSMDFRGHVWYEKNNVLDFINKYEIYIDELVKSIINSPEKIIGFSVQSTSKFFSLEIARRIKEKDKNKIIIFGGPLCFRNCYDINILSDYPFINFVCFGEAEESFSRVIHAIEKNVSDQSYPGFGCRLSNGMIIDGGDIRLIENLDGIPFADYSCFDFKKYTKNILPISTSRGCMNRCRFCSESTHWRKYRRRSASNIFEEIKYQLKKYPQIEGFWFNDSLINGDMKMLNELCDLLILNRIKIGWGGQATIHKEMTKDFLKKIKIAGCKIISYGIESGSNQMLNLMHKGFTAELAEEVLRETSEAGIDTIFNIMIGFPGEGDTEFEETERFVQRCRRYTVHIELVTFLLLKGCYVYNNLDEYNIAPIDYNEPDWQLKWETKDDQNNYEIRKNRLEQLRQIVDY